MAVAALFGPPWAVRGGGRLTCDIARLGSGGRRSASPGGMPDPEEDDDADDGLPDRGEEDEEEVGDTLRVGEGEWRIEDPVLASWAARSGKAVLACQADACKWALLAYGDDPVRRPTVVLTSALPMCNLVRPRADALTPALLARAASSCSAQALLPAPLRSVSPAC